MGDGPWLTSLPFLLWSCLPERQTPPGGRRHIAANDPASVLADIAAKRAILRLAELQFQPHAVMDGMGWEQYESGLTAAYRAVVAHLIQPFAAHPDFDESWKL